MKSVKTSKLNVWFDKPSKILSNIGNCKILTILYNSPSLINLSFSYKFFHVVSSDKFTSMPNSLAAVKANSTIEGNAAEMIAEFVKISICSLLNDLNASGALNTLRADSSPLISTILNWLLISFAKPIISTILYNSPPSRNTPLLSYELSQPI